MSAFFGLRSVFLFVFVVAGVGIVLGLCAAAVRHGNNVFKQQGVAWIITIVMVVAAIGVGYAKSPANNVAAPRPDYQAPNDPTTPPENMVPVYPVEAYVRDDAAVLSNRTEEALNDRNIRLLDQYDVLVGVVTCNYNRDDLGQYAADLFEDMGLGGYDMLVVLDISGDNYWLYTGNDVAWDFSDETCADYTWTYMEDEFAAGNYDDAVLNLTEALEAWYELYY